MTLIEAYKRIFWDDLLTISGRASRKEYWGGQLVFIGILILISNFQQTLVGIFIAWFYIATWTSGIRRMHDVGKSGWFILIPLYNLILALSESQQFDNKWGSPSSHTVETQNNEDSEKIEDE